MKVLFIIIAVALVSSCSKPVKECNCKSQLDSLQYEFNHYKKEVDNSLLQQAIVDSMILKLI